MNQNEAPCTCHEHDAQMDEACTRLQSRVELYYGLLIIAAILLIIIAVIRIVKSGVTAA